MSAIFILDLQADTFFFAVAFVLIASIAVLGGIIYLVYLPFKIELLKSGRLTKNRSKRIDKIYLQSLLLIAALSFLIFAIAFGTA